MRGPFVSSEEALSSIVWSRRLNGLALLGVILNIFETGLVIFESLVVDLLRGVIGFLPSFVIIALMIEGSFVPFAMEII